MGDTSGSAAATPSRGSSGWATVAIFIGLAALGGFLCYLAGRVLADLRSDSWPLLVAAGLLLVAAWVVLSFAAGQLRIPGGGHPSLGGAFHWLTIASTGLVLVAGLG